MCFCIAVIQYNKQRRVYMKKVKDQLLTLNGVAEFLNVTRSTVLNMEKENKLIPLLKIGSRGDRRYCVDDVIKQLTKGGANNE